MKKSFKQSAIGCLLTLTLIFSFSTISFAQTETADAPVVVPDEQMEQIVRRILIYYFKPSKKPKIVFLAEKGIRQEWLPEIKNVRFHLLSAEEVKQKGDVRFFTEPTRETDRYNIGLGQIDGNCTSGGDSWSFRISKQKLRLWLDGGRLGGECSGTNH